VVNKGNESAGSRIRSEIDNMRYEIKDNMKKIHSERNTIHPTITTRIFSSNQRTFALNFGQKTQTSYNSICFSKFPTNLAYIEKMKYISQGAAWLPFFLTAISRLGKTTLHAPETLRMELSKNRKQSCMSTVNHL
jgi:hypothetical protein